MAKRSTIGENPLDAVIQENPLDTVVPALSVAAKTGRGPAAPELAAEVQKRLQELEAGLKTLRAEVEGLKASAGEAASLKGELARLRPEVEQLKTEAGAVSGLKAEVTRLKEELVQVQAASAGPGDLPWWMRRRRK
jgi:predicted RNase H-like nuclease (RuvC/YqgF family)